MNDDAMIDRALRAYLRRGSFMMQPSRSSCTVDNVDGKLYVVLRNGSGPLAVYEVQGNPVADYKLVGLQAVPAGIE